MNDNWTKELDKHWDHVADVLSHDMERHKERFFLWWGRAHALAEELGGFEWATGMDEDDDFLVGEHRFEMVTQAGLRIAVSPSHSLVGVPGERWNMGIYAYWPRLELLGAAEWGTDQHGSALVLLHYLMDLDGPPDDWPSAFQPPSDDGPCDGFIHDHDDPTVCRLCGWSVDEHP